MDCFIVCFCVVFEITCKVALCFVCRFTNLFNRQAEPALVCLIFSEVLPGYPFPLKDSALYIVLLFCISTRRDFVIYIQVFIYSTIFEKSLVISCVKFKNLYASGIKVFSFRLFCFPCAQYFFQFFFLKIHDESSLHVMFTSEQMLTLDMFIP